MSASKLPRGPGLCFLLIAFTGLAWGQEYPSQPVRIIVPFPAGGSTDTYARIIGNEMRATLGKGTTDIRVLMTHPMETGQRKDGEGKIVPLHFIQKVTVKQNGKTVIDSQISQAVSRNPVFFFRLRGGAKGDKIEVSWLDNKGETNKTETAVA